MVRPRVLLQGVASRELRGAWQLRQSQDWDEWGGGAVAAQGCLGAGTAFGPWISGPTGDSEPLLTIPSGPLLVNMPDGMSDTSPNTGIGR